MAIEEEQIMGIPENVAAGKAARAFCEMVEEEALCHEQGKKVFWSTIVARILQERVPVSKPKKLLPMNKGTMP